MGRIFFGNNNSELVDKVTGKCLMFVGRRPGQGRPEICEIVKNRDERFAVCEVRALFEENPDGSTVWECLVSPVKTSAIIRRADFTPESLSLGLWDSLLEIAGIKKNSENSDDCDEIDIRIINAKLIGWDSEKGRNMICPSCGGIVGRDCFNVAERMAISEAQERDRQRDAAARLEQLENNQETPSPGIVLKCDTCEIKNPSMSNCFDCFLSRPLCVKL